MEKKVQTVLEKIQATTNKPGPSPDSPIANLIAFQQGQLTSIRNLVGTVMDDAAAAKSDGEE